MITNAQFWIGTFTGIVSTIIGAMLFKLIKEDLDSERQLERDALLFDTSRKVEQNTKVYIDEMFDFLSERMKALESKLPTTKTKKGK